MSSSVVRKTIAAQARDDVLAMLRQMGPVLAVLGCIYIVAAMCWFIAPVIVPTWIGRYTLRMLMFAGLAWGAAPFYVALHRFVAYREVRWLPSLDVVNGPARLYGAYAAISMMFYFAPFIGREVFTALGLPVLSALAFLVLTAAGWTTLVRVTTILPMAALDPDNTSFWRAFMQSKGRAWQYFLGLTVIATPPFGLLMIINSAASNGAIAWPVYFPLAIAALLFFQLLPLAAATHLYRERAEAEAPAA